MPDPKDFDVTIRPPEAGDMDALADLMTELGYETRTSEMEMRMETILANKNYSNFLKNTQCFYTGLVRSK